jgi:glutamate dehydrogenase
VKANTGDATRTDTTAHNEAWLRGAMAPNFFDAMQDEPEAVGILGRELQTLRTNHRLILADRPHALMLATLNRPGSLYQTLRTVQDRAISYAMFAHSTEAVPSTDLTLEIARFEFEREAAQEPARAKPTPVPAELRAAVAAALKKNYPEFDATELDALLGTLWRSNESYVRIAPPRRVAQTLRLLQQANRAGGLHLDVEDPDDVRGESSVFFAVANPPRRGFLIQVMEVLNRLDLGVKHAYCLAVPTGSENYFLGTFYVRPRKGGALRRDSALHAQLERELFNTQVLSTSSPAYSELVTSGVMSGEDASLVNAFIAFCHTNLAHAQPDRFGLDEVRSAFHSNPQFALQLVSLFRTRFDPQLPKREQAYATALAEAERAVREYNTGHRYLDDIRRHVFRCCVAFIRHTLKTNFFVMEKRAFAFRLDPAYLAELGRDFTDDLPPATPFRVTFFFSRYGFGYHIGFSDIARGGWRTVIARTQDDLITSANTLFRENFVLAHTQHFKNKDIYEGGSKLVMLMDASRRDWNQPGLPLRRLHALQRGVANAFLDVFITEDGVAKHPNVVDYYREDEPIEIGPDENMHDEMIEQIAQLSARRGYMLGIGIMSSKEVGINHKEYAVTSTGVVKFAEISLKEIGIDMRRDAFSVKITGGPNGDVAGNGMRLLLARCPKAELRLILDGTAALVDPKGADRGELERILLKQDLDAFDPKRLHPGGFMLFRSGQRKEGLRELYRKVVRTPRGVQEEWISVDEFSKQFGELVFTVQADLFIPAGGRPETIDAQNWQKFLLPDGTPSARVIVEGANSFITPEARVQLQQRGVLLMRDASANKCGVISSSYEIIANLLLTPEEFLEHKARYVKDVLAILERRAADEARLILERRRTQGKLCTEISESLSGEINAHYARLFAFFQARPELSADPVFERALLHHLPAILREEPRFRKRVAKLPQKYRSAIMAAEIGSSMVYRGDTAADFEDVVRLHVARSFPEPGSAAHATGKGGRTSNSSRASAARSAASTSAGVPPRANANPR